VDGHKLIVCGEILLKNRVNGGVRDAFYWLTGIGAVGKNWFWAARQYPQEESVKAALPVRKADRQMSIGDNSRSAGPRTSPE
jgi:hypothetical protein